MSAIKVAYMLDSFRVGGTELNAVRTAEAIDRSNFELVAFYLNDEGPLKSRYRSLGIRLNHVPIPNLYSWRTARQAISLCAAFRRERIDVVHAHDVYTNILVAPWARTLTSGSVICSRRWGEHPPDPRLGTANRLSYRFAHVVLSNSTSVADYMVSNEGVPRHKITCIPNFLDEQAFSSGSFEAREKQLRAWGVPEGAYVVGAVCRLSAVKNLEMLIEAAGDLDGETHVVVIGDGPSRAEYLALVRERHLDDRVHFVGEMLGAGNLHRFFDLSVSCSHSEGFPNSLIEAMAVGNPVVATDVGGVGEAVSHEETGELVPPGDRRAFVSAVERIRKSPQLAARYGRLGTVRARAHFSRSTVVSRLENVYRTLAEREPVDAD